MNTISRKSPRFNTAESRDEGVLDLWREPAARGRGVINPSEAWLFLRRNLVRILGVGALLGALTFVAAYFLFQKYSATAVVVVDPRSARVTQSGGVLASIGGDAIAIESLVQVAHSDGFLGDIVDELDLGKDPAFAGKGATPAMARLATIEKLGSKLTIARRGTTYVIDVTVATSSAEKSAQIANAAAKKFVEDQSLLRSGANATAAKEIQSRLAELRSRVSRAEDAAAQLKTRLKVTDTGQGSTLLERRVAELNQQLVLAGARTAEARARYELVRRANALRGDNLPQTVQSTVLASLRTEFARLSRQSADQATVLGPRHPDVASLNAQIADVRRQIVAEIARMTTAARNDYVEAEQRESSLSLQMKNAQSESGLLGPEMVKLGELEREAKAERGVYEELLNRQRELVQVKGLEPSDVRLVSPALTPSKPTPTLPSLIVGSAALGLLTGFFYALWREWRRGTLKTAAQAEGVSKVEMGGFVPQLGATRGKLPAKTGGAATPDLTPWLSDLCAELNQPTQGEGLMLLVASAKRGEGRSAIAANLAFLLGEGGDRVLLIEADRPTRGARQNYGLVDVLESGVDLRGALVDPPGGGYTLLPFGGGKGRQLPVAALMSGLNLRATLKLARQWFDVVVIDGPPALEAPYARLLAVQADQTIFLVEWDKTSSADAESAIERLAFDEGIVLYNKVDPDRLSLYDPAHSRLMAKQASELADAV